MAVTSVTWLCLRDFNHVIRDIGDSGSVVSGLNACIQMRPDFRCQVEMKVRPDTPGLNKRIHTRKG
jgi:hypothetical protein